MSERALKWYRVGGEGIVSSSSVAGIDITAQVGSGLPKVCTLTCTDDSLLGDAEKDAEQALREMHNALAEHFAPVLRWTFDERGTAFAELGQWRLEAGRGGWFVSVETPRNGRQYVATGRGVIDRSEARRAAEAALRALGVAFRVGGE